MKFIELKNKTKKELSELWREGHATLSRLNFESSDNILKNSSQIKKTKKDIARIMTALRNL